jgi:phasin
MSSNNKPKLTSENKEAPEQFREMTATATEQSKEFLGQIGTATTEAANVMQNCYSRALKGMQDYHSKVLEFTDANTKSHVAFIQKLSGVKSPSEFFELSTEHTGRQLKTLAEQTKHLTELAQQATLATVEPIKSGFTKAYDRAA